MALPNGPTFSITKPTVFLLGLDYDMLLPMEDTSATDAAVSDDLAWTLDVTFDLDDILVENTNDFVFLDNLAGSE
uniref:Uncharacterized protein n=1 Tax=Oryza nivara TaxID=4536 RepID=A0A0E0I9M7_ORYNI